MLELGPFGNQFLKHILNFIKQTGFVFPSQMAVAVSAGKDSMVLLHILTVMKQRMLFDKLHVFHVNHGTRIENDSEENLVKEFCDQYDLIFHVNHLKLSFTSNFENIARNMRRDFFSARMKELDNDSILCTGHHLDDSFEWSLMQQFKSSSLMGGLGIPLRQGHYFRPLLCVSKKQIEKYIFKENVSYKDDPSNDDEKFERNYIRKQVIPNLDKKYPQMLKHYAFRQNRLASKLGVSLIGKHRDQKKRVVPIINIVKMPGVSIFFNRDGLGEFSGAEEDLCTELKTLSNKGRGRLAKQVSQLVNAVKKGKEGPFSLSGGVKAYYFQGSIILANNIGLDFFKVLDSKLTLGVSQIPGSLYKWPLLAFGSKKLNKAYPTLKKVHPLLPMFTQRLIDKGLWFQHFGRLVALENKSILPLKDIKVYNLKDVMQLDSL